MEADMGSLRRITALLMGLLLLLVACAPEDEEVAPPAEQPAEAPAEETPAEQPEEEPVAAEGCDDVDYDNPPGSPVTIRMGHGAAAEEPFWLMTVQPELTEHQGTWYDIQMEPFRATADRLVAYQAGELDAVIITPNALITGEAREGLDLYSVAVVMREAEAGAYSTTFLALEDSGITSTEDLAGSTMTIVDIGSHLDVLARSGVVDGGHNPDTDVEYVVFPFPAQEDALREGQVDVIGIPEPFYSLAHANGGVVDVYSAADVLDFAFDLLTLAFDRTFLEENVEAVCAWREDYKRTMDHWRNNNEEARRTLAATDYIPLPEDLYLQIGDYERPADGVVDIDGLGEFMEAMLEFGLIEEGDRVDPQVFVYPGVTSGH
jgi:ABC-type nitrate/sulfonate/bicarbonate transport system substrate-binding protein